MYAKNMDGLGNVDWTSIFSKAADTVTAVATTRYNAKIAQTNAKVEKDLATAQLNAQLTAAQMQSFPTSLSTGINPNQYVSDSGGNLNKYLPLILIGGAALVAIMMLGKSSPAPQYIPVSSRGR